MVIIHLSGGFGNQLYSYAFGYAMARMRNDTLCIDTAIQDMPWFFRNPDILNLNIKFDRRLSYCIGRKLWDRALLNKVRYKKAIGKHTPIFRENKDIGYLKEYFELTKNYDDIYLRGNWVSEKFFLPYKAEILELFEFQESMESEAMAVYKEIVAEENSVTLHCRRGDYVPLGICLDSDYYAKAMKYISSCVQKPVFFCFSEDQEWLKHKFKGEPFDIRYPEYSSTQKGIDDFRLLQAGKHQIIANSTYSWWAAYLNSNKYKIVVAPYADIWDDEFCLKEWFKIPVKL